MVLDPKDWFNYDPETGIITWSRDRGKKVKAGSKPNHTNSDGYRKIKLDGKVYQEHRLAWYLHYGVWPVGVIDHLNRDKTDNRILNLRDVSVKTNLNNRLRVARAYRKPSGRWQARVSFSNTKVYLGTHETKEKAIEVGQKFLEHT